jgi:hypothetical protein
MQTLYLYFEDAEGAWYAMVADQFETICKYRFAGDRAQQEAAMQEMASNMKTKEVLGWDKLFVDVDDDAVGMQLMDVEEILYAEAVAPVWTAPAAEPTMTALLDIETAGEELLELLLA